MQITHEHARKLIQFRLDGGLQSAEKETLSAHLQGCSECQTYAVEIKEVETVLRPVLKRQWNAQPIPLSITSLRGNSQKTQAHTLLTMRTAAISLVFFAFFFSVWQFTLPSPSAPSVMPLAVPSVPTPSTQTARSTSTEFTVEACEMMLYTVQADDTLTSIADHFLVSEELLTELNQLGADAVHPSMELVIPICHFTPTGTIHPATFTTTYTPLFLPTTSTPGG
jgi:hypothetical protein